MDSKHHAEQLTAPVCRVISAVEWWAWASRWHPGLADLERAEEIRDAVAALIAKLTVLNFVLGEEIDAARVEVREREARQEPGVDVLAGAEG